MLEELWGGGMVLCGYRPPPAGRGTSTVATGLTHGCVWLAGCAAAAMPPFCPIVTDVRALCGCVLCGDRIELVAVDRSGSFGRHPSAGMTSGECGEAQSEPCPLVWFGPVCDSHAMLYICKSELRKS